MKQNEILLIGAGVLAWWIISRPAQAKVNLGRGVRNRIDEIYRPLIVNIPQGTAVSAADLGYFESDANGYSIIP